VVNLQNSSTQQQLQVGVWVVVGGGVSDLADELFNQLVKREKLVRVGAEEAAALVFVL
jgi:hypothetical protein